jgi:CheY-like chemotaxis protein
VNQKVVELMLTRQGHTVDTVGNGRLAVDALLAHDYDVVLMDIQMPVMDGLTATALLRSELPPQRQPYVIALTASTLLEDRTAARQAGVDAHLTKPARPYELEDALLAARTSLEARGPEGAERRAAGHDPSAVLPGQRAPLEDAGAAAGPARAADPPGRPPDDAHDDVAAVAAGIRARMAEVAGPDADAAADVLGAVLVSFAGRAPDLLAALTAALDASDAASARGEAHALKGSAGNVGADALAACAAQLEDLAAGGRLDAARAALPALAAQVPLAVAAALQVRSRSAQV